LAEIVSDVLIAGEETIEMAEVSEVGAPGPLGPFVVGFAAELSRQGYKPQPVGKQLGLLAALNGSNLRASASSAARTSRSTTGRDALVAMRGTRPLTFGSARVTLIAPALS